MSDNESFDFVPTKQDGNVSDGSFEFQPPPQISATEAVNRGISSGFTLGYEPRLKALSQASGIGTSIRGPNNEYGYVSHGPIESLVGAGRIGLEKLAPETFGTSASEMYNKTLAEEKARQESAREQYPIATFASEVGGSMVNPLFKAIPAPEGVKTFLENAKSAALPSGVLGSIQGSAEGDTWQERGMNALKGLLGGSIVGGTMSGALGKIMPSVTPPPSTVPAKEIVSAAERLSSSGSPIQVPKIIASENEPLLSISSVARDLPFTGTPLKTASEKMAQQLETKIGELSQGETRNSAGVLAKQGLEDWINIHSRKIISDAYDAVDPLITNPSTQTLDATRKAAQKISDELKNQKLLVEDPAVKMLMNAITDPTGLDYSAIKGLRTRIGKMMDDPSDVFKDAAPSLKQLYGGLTEDLKNSIQNGGGKPALDAFETANNLNKDIANQRNILLKITGTDKNARSGDQIFDTLVKFAGSSGKTDIPKLLTAKQSLPEDAWGTIASGIVDHLSTNKSTNSFDPASFFRNYNKLSNDGKNILFGDSSSSLRQNLNDLASIGTRIDRMSTLSSSQGGGERKLLTAAELLAAAFHPVKTAIGLTGGRMFASAMSEPATAQSVNNWAKAYEVFASKPSSATANAFVQATQAMSTEAGGRHGMPSPDNILNTIIATSETAKLASYLHNAMTDMSPPENKQQDNSRAVFDNQSTGGRIERARGGKVTNSKKQMLVKRLMDLAEKAKKEVSKNTEPLLNAPDEAIVKALHVANQAI